jgi:leucyl-tRNA synthetase
MDPNNETEFCSREKSDYWNQVDVYIGGAEHAVGHLLYSRFWCKVLHDLGHISFDEPYKKLINQGMIQGKGYYVIRNLATSTISGPVGSPAQATNHFIFGVNKGKRILNEDKISTNQLELIEKFKLSEHLFKIRDIEQFVTGENTLFEEDYLEYLKNWFEFHPYKNDLETCEFMWQEDKDGLKFIELQVETEKMSKSKYNVVNPDDIIKEYGADTFRMYEMFLGPLEISKPWDTKGIEGVHRFIKKLWRLFYNENDFLVNNEPPKEESFKTLHQTIEKVEKATASFSLNTAVSQFMICVNELSLQKCNSKEVLEPLLILLTPYAPHVCEELWSNLGHNTSITKAIYPILNKEYLVENEITYPIAINGKRKMELLLPADMNAQEAEEFVLAKEEVLKLIQDKTVRKFIFVQGRMINIVV